MAILVSRWITNHKGGRSTLVIRYMQIVGISCSPLSRQSSATIVMSGLHTFCAVPLVVDGGIVSVDASGWKKPIAKFVGCLGRKESIEFVELEMIRSCCGTVGGRCDGSDGDHQQGGKKDGGSRRRHRLQAVRRAATLVADFSYSFYLAGLAGSLAG